VEVFIVIQAFIWFTVIKRYSCEFPAIELWFFTLGITSLNYFIFLHRNKWKKYIHTFKSLTKQHNFLGGVFILVIIFLIFFGLIYSFYQTSLIDWKKINASKYYE
jgi:hypothetical protein